MNFEFIIYLEFNFMARFGKKPILIPEGVEVKIEDNFIKCKGPKGELVFKFDKNLKAEKKDNTIIFSTTKKTKETLKLLGTARSCTINTLSGVKEGYERKLEIVGVGFRVQLQGKKLVLYLGFSHPQEIKAPEGIEFKITKNIISVFGLDKQLVGGVAAKIRALKPPEPYKGKGIRYFGEHLRKKLGKRAVVSAAGPA